ncbi:MAG: hypothetical protein ACUVX1_16180 [Chloroflexota bacterium]
MTQTAKLAAISASLGSPAGDFASVLIYEGDCLELMQKLPDGCVDLTVTSPPHNIGKEYEKVRKLADYVEWCHE